MRETLAGDMHRYGGAPTWRTFLQHYRDEPGFRYTVWMRLCTYLRWQSWSRVGLYHLAKNRFDHYGHKYGIHIHFTTPVGAGLYIGHTGSIVVNSRAVIGRNCCLGHEVTLGVTNRGKNPGVPTLGDRVYLAPGVKVIGGIRLGNDVAVGANAVVTSDLPDHAVAVGIPARILSYEGTEGYATNCIADAVSGQG